MSRAVFARRAPRAVIVAVIGVAVVVGGVAVIGVAFPPKDDPTSLRPLLDPDTYPAAPISAGTPAPAFEAAGWLNGPPAAFDGTGPKLVVLDVWTGWCPVCRDTAPGLSRVYRKYRDRGVAFVSLSDVPRYQAEAFVEHFDVPWPCGYGASVESLARYGTYDPSRRASTHHPAFEIMPTLFVFDSRGRVVWNDDRARTRHTKDADALVADLDAAIGRSLGE